VVHYMTTQVYCKKGVGIMRPDKIPISCFFIFCANVFASHVMKGARVDEGGVAPLETGLDLTRISRFGALNVFLRADDTNMETEDRVRARESYCPQCRGGSRCSGFLAPGDRTPIY